MTMALFNKRSKGRTAEFGKKVLYHVPKKLRSKLDLRWRAGIFLGTSNGTNEIFIGAESGAVVRSRSMVRVVPESRWSAASMLKIAGTPMKPNPKSDNSEGDAWIEETMNPHEPTDHDVELVARPAALDEEMKQRAAQRLRITKNDLTT